jgi:hypothetical protein
LTEINYIIGDLVHYISSINNRRIVMTNQEIRAFVEKNFDPMTWDQQIEALKSMNSKRIRGRPGRQLDSKNISTKSTREQEKKSPKSEPGGKKVQSQLAKPVLMSHEGLEDFVSVIWARQLHDFFIQHGSSSKALRELVKDFIDDVKESERSEVEGGELAKPELPELTAEELDLLDDDEVEESVQGLSHIYLSEGRILRKLNKPLEYSDLAWHRPQHCAYHNADTSPTDGSAMMSCTRAAMNSLCKGFSCMDCPQFKKMTQPS